MRRHAGLLALVLAWTGVAVAGGGLAGAAFTTHESNQQTFTAGNVPGPADLVAQSRTNDGGASSTQIQYGLKLTNTGGQGLDLDDVTVRYWFTVDGSPGSPMVDCYYAAFGCNKIQQSVADLPSRLEGADHYAQVTFTQGRLDPGASASLDQLAIRDPGGETYTQGDDYSFLNQGGFTDNQRVTVYVGGQLVWGTEPQPLPEIEALEVQYANLDGAPQDNAIKPGLKIRNTGTVPLDLRDVTVRYWFSSEEAKQFQGFCDFADRGCANVTTDFSKAKPGGPGADTYLEVGFSGGTLAPGGNTGQIQLRVHGKKFELFDERDDYSRGTNTSFASTMKVAAYLDGTLVWGNPP